MAALQAAESVRFAESQVEQQLAAGVHPRVIGRGIADQIALACRVSPTRGSRRLDCPGVVVRPAGDLRLLTAGRVSEYVASLVVSETGIFPQPSVGKSTRRLSTPGSPGWVRGGRRPVPAATPTGGPHGYRRGVRTERRHRRVGLRPAPDTMAILSGYLPVDQGVACLAALRRHTDTVKADGDRRSRDQIMADTLVERLTDKPPPPTSTSKSTC